MNPICQWKHLITRANQAFAHDHFALAAGLYQHAAALLSDIWPQYMQNQQHMPQQQWQDSVVQLVICYSVSVQNLAETYARQQRWRRCLSVLRRSLSVVQHLLQQLPPAHPACIALLRESGHIRREFCRFSQQRLLLTADSVVNDNGWLH